MPKPDPRQFGDMPSARHRKERAHLVDIIADESESLESKDVSEKSNNKNTRTTRSGETVRRATFWFTEEDLDVISRLQRVVDVPDIPGVPDKSAVVREAVRRLAETLLKPDD